MFNEIEQKNLITIIKTIQKHCPNAFSKEGIRKLVGSGVLDFDSAANSIESIERFELEKSTEGVEQENIIEPENNPKRDEEVKNLVNPGEVKFDIIIEMTKNNDSMLYNTYRNAVSDLEAVTKTMVEKAGADFSSMLGHIDSLLDEGEGDKELFKKLREKKLKII